MSRKQILLILVLEASIEGIALSETNNTQVENMTPTATAICDPIHDSCGNFTPVTAINTPTPDSTDTPNITVTSTPDVISTDTPIITIIPNNTLIPTVTDTSIPTPTDTPIPNPTNTPIPNQKATVILTFDDGWLSVYTKAYPILRANDQSGVAFVNVEPVLGGWPDFMSKDDLDIMYNSGWDISSHTYSHVDLTTLNDSTLKHELNDSKNWLDINGYTKSSAFLSYPYGGTNTNIINTMKSYGYLAARVVNDTTTYKYYNLNGSDVFMMEDYETIGGIDNDVSVINQINNAAAVNGLLILSFHKIVDNLSADADTASTEFKISDFQNVSNYLKNNNINVVTLSTYFNIKPAPTPVVTNTPIPDITATPIPTSPPANIQQKYTSEGAHQKQLQIYQVYYRTPIPTVIPKVNNTPIPKVTVDFTEEVNAGKWIGNTEVTDTPGNIDTPRVESKGILERIRVFIMSLIRRIYVR